MPESKRDSNLQKGARVINAAIAELELPAELKVSAQQVVTMFATDLLPGLWLRREAPAPEAPKPGTGEASSEDEALASLRREIRTMVDTDDDDEVRPPDVSAASSDKRPRSRASTPKPGRPVTTRRESAPRPPWDESETKLVEAALVTLRYAYLSQISQLEAAILSAMNRRADSGQVLEMLLGAQEYHRAAPALRALQALSPPVAKSDRH